MTKYSMPEISKMPMKSENFDRSFMNAKQGYSMQTFDDKLIVVYPNGGVIIFDEETGVLLKLF